MRVEDVPATSIARIRRLPHLLPPNHIGPSLRRKYVFLVLEKGGHWSPEVGKDGSGVTFGKNLRNKRNSCVTSGGQNLSGGRVPPDMHMMEKSQKQNVINQINKEMGTPYSGTPVI